MLHEFSNLWGSGEAHHRSRPRSAHALADLERPFHALEEQYFLVVPALDGHVEEERTTFLSVEAEAQKIEDFLQEMVSGEASIVCGLSMGGAISFELYRRNRCRIQNLILD